MDPKIVQGITFFFAIVIALTIHEASHALAAKLRGDDTAESLGRLTLNPIAHVDIMGTIVFPIILFFTSGSMFGWAKPVPVDPRKFKSPRIDNLIVSLAGPASNLFLSFLGVLALTIYAVHFPDALVEGSFFYPIINLLQALVYINAILAVFNMIPIPPLDGSSVVIVLLPPRYAQKFEDFIRPYGFFILIMLMISNGFHWVFDFATAYIGLVSILVNHLVI